ncbi:MAG: hypothetical protein DRJ35_00885 [Thermoprotei archaeon]|nr:MAG: hypothetical protein DRJ35_00885 [Thermoprotei archaeon]
MSHKKKELWEEARKKGRLEDDFEEMSEYWDYRKDNFAGFKHEGSILKLWMGPTEALYYSNAEISDGTFDFLPWTYKTLEAKVRLLGHFYGSAGWGFWNYTMVIDPCMPIWFIYLRTRGPYPFQGLFAQVGNQFQPIMLFEKPALLTMASIISNFAPSIMGLKILSDTPTLQSLKLDEWHVYRVEWSESMVRFVVDDFEVARIPYNAGPIGARADVWIDNAVYEARRNDAGRVYRHVTQENRTRSFLEIDYIKIF